MAYSVGDIIEIAEVSQYLVGNDIAEGALFGPRLDPRLAVMLYMERKAVQWLYDLDPTESTLFSSAAYLYSLCKFSGQAANIAGSGSGGVIVIASGGGGAGTVTSVGLVMP